MRSCCVDASVELGEASRKAGRRLVFCSINPNHMADLYLEGLVALKLLSELGVNSFKNFNVNTAKQFVPVSHEGYAILFYLD